MGLDGDNGKEHGNDYNCVYKFFVQGLGLRVNKF